jgi:dTDP-4-dehydrorhamnose reductase
MKVLLTGASGQLGSELLPLLSAQGEITATDRIIPDSAVGSWVGLDVSNGGNIEVLLNRLRPDLIVNTAAYTAVDHAETEPETVFEINAALPGRLARWAKNHDARLLHYSTDYVFDGKAKEPYLETDIPNPQSVYGDSKLAGERAIEVSGCAYVTLRTSWVYSSHGSNFVLSMLALARKGLSLKVVDDQHGCPTWARNLALASNVVIERWQTSGADNRCGLFHYCDDHSLSWYRFAQILFDFAVKSGVLKNEPDLTPIPGSEFPQLAKRPNWSVLNCNKIDRLFNIRPASFKQSLQIVIDEIRTRE